MTIRSQTVDFSRFGLIKNISPFVHPASSYFLLFFGQVDKIITFRTAGGLHFFPAVITLNKEQVTGIIHTVYMGVCRFSALVTMGNDFISHSFSQSLVKNKILSMEFVFQSTRFYLVHIINDTALQVKYIFKTLVEHVS